MRKMLLIGVAMTLVTTNAVAADWFILSFQDAKCLNVRAEKLLSPHDYESALRTSKEFDETRITRDRSGAPAVVVVKSTDGRGVMFFPSRNLCLDGLHVALAKGAINNPDELK